MAGYREAAGKLGYNVLDDYKVNNDTLAGLENPSFKVGRTLNTLQIGPIAAVVGAMLAGQTPTKNPSKPMDPGISKPMEPGISKPIEPEISKPIEPGIINPTTSGYMRGFGTEALPKEIPKGYIEKNIITPYMETTGAVPELNYTPSNEIENTKEMQATLNPATSGYMRGFGTETLPKQEWWDVVGTPAQIMEQLKEKEMPNDMAISNENDGTATGEIPVVDENGKVVLKPHADVIAGSAVAEKEEILPSNRDQSQKDEKEEDKNKFPFIPSINLGDEYTMPELQDVTKANQEYKIDYSGLEQWLLNMQERQWAEERARQAHIEQREDNAYERAVESARRAGINVNLMDIQPAASGGGFTAPSGIYSGILENAMSGHSNRYINSQNVESQEFIAQMNNAVKMLELELNNNFKGDENTKDRITDLITELINGAAMWFAFKKTK